MAKAKNKDYFDVLDRIKTNTTLDYVTTLADSKLFNEKDFVPTGIPILNVPFSGSLNGGMSAGVTIVAGVSKNFKTGLLLLLMQAYLKAYPESVAMFYINEFGSPSKYFESYGIDPARVVVNPVTNIEKCKIDMTKQIDTLKRGDRVFFGVDSFGNMASLKEVEDALKEKTVADMSRAKAMKSLFRIVTPELTLKNFPMVGIGHTYKTQDLFPTDVVSGGTGAYYAADNVFIIGREQDAEEAKVDGKKKKVINGYRFKIKVDKGRFVKEKSIFNLDVGFETGISRWSGLLDEAVAAGLVEKGKEGNRNVFVYDGKTYVEEDTDNKTFWMPLLENPAFDAAITKKYALGNTKMVEDIDA